MDLFEKDPALTKAVALTLARQAQEMLATVEEADAARYLGMAIDALLRRSPEPQPLTN